MIRSTWRSFRWRRQATFGLVGVTSMLVGSYGSLFLLVDILEVNPSIGYFLQAIVAIELNYVLNYFITWRDRPAVGRRDAVARWLKFHATRMFTVPFNLALFSVLVVLGIQYLIANTICIAVTTVLNYVAGDRFVFTAKTTQKPKEMG